MGYNIKMILHSYIKAHYGGCKKFSMVVICDFIVLLLCIGVCYNYNNFYGIVFLLLEIIIVTLGIKYLY